MATGSLPDAVVIVLAAPMLCLVVIGLYLRWLTRGIYKRIGNYAISEVTFDMQLQYPGLNFPGPNVLESVIAAQPTGLQAAIGKQRRRLRHWRRTALSYVGFLFAVGLVVSVLRKLSW